MLQDNPNLSLFCALTLVSACSSSEAPEFDNRAPEVPDAPALVLEGARGCALDADCAPMQVCFQSRCAMAAEEAAADVVPGLSVVGPAEGLVRVPSGQGEVSITVEVEGPVPPAGLAYRVTRADQPEVERVQVVPVAEGQATLTLAAGRAGAEEPEPVAVQIVTAGGTVRLTLTPELSEAGLYGGAVTLATFGGQRLPIELSVVTDPPGAALSDASAAYVVLPVRPGSLFSPLPPSEDGPDHVTRPLVYDAFVRAWVAQFELPFDPPEGSALAWVRTSSNAVTRAMRFELSPNGSGALVGRFADIWSGVLDQRAPGGQPTSAELVFDGDLELSRLGSPPALDAVTPPVTYETAEAGVLPLPDITAACGGLPFDATTSRGNRNLDCDTIGDASAFTAAVEDAQSACAVAMADAALAADTTSGQIRDYLDDSTPNPGGRSFADFLEACAAGRDGTCIPSPEVLCARQLAAYTLTAHPTPPDSAWLLEAYQDTTNEAFLGRQFAAFHTDAQTRLEWLEAQDYPAIVTSAVEGLVEGLLETWQEDVLDAHLLVIAGQMDAAGLSILAQRLEGTEARDGQRRLVFDVTQSWRGAADALALGAARWDTLLRALSDREAKASLVYDRAFDLYLLAGILSEQNRALDAGANNAVFGPGFRALLRHVGALDLPFDRLVYERQGEVVVSTSLDPTSGNDELLESLRGDAIAELERADAAVTAVIADSQAELLAQTELTNRIQNEADALAAEITELCGLPDECGTPDGGACRPRVEIGRCGFRTDSSGDVLAMSTSEASVSEAGRALLDIRAAFLALQRAQETSRAHAAKTDLYYRTAEAFADRVSSWNDTRRGLLTEIQNRLTDLQASNQATLSTLAANYQAQIAENDSGLVGFAEFIDQWDEIAVAGAQSDLETEAEIYGYRSGAEVLEDVAEAIEAKAEWIVKGMPTAPDDLSWSNRLVIGLESYYVTTGMKIGASALNSQAEAVQRELTKRQTLRDAELTVLELENDLSSAAGEVALERLRNEAALVTTENAQEQRLITELIDLAIQEVEATLALERDLVELRDRRDKVHARLIEAQGLQIEEQQAVLTVEQALNAYEQVVLRAQLMNARWETVRGQLANISQIVGSPSAVFAWANQLSRAEARLARAKEALTEWLIALEYFAVRPFFDTRIQILLARNTTQLEAISQDMLRIQSSCGGAVNTEIVELSVRDDLLGFSQSVLDLQTGTETGPAERFRRTLEAARIPVDKRIRYRSDATVGDLLNQGGVLAATFDVGLSDLANLATTCNAKIASVAVKLVGEDLGSGRPTVGLLYDGTSQLRSCQPNIRSIVESVGADVTPFAEITELKAAGRSISPLAGLDVFPDSQNRSLGGLPLASQYTVLIDTSVGENRDVDWSRLEDIELRVEYTFQDLFPAGQCE